MLETLETRTGKSMSQWLALLNQAQISTPAEYRTFLKEQKLGAASIALIIDHLAGKSPQKYDPHAIVAALFKGPKQALLPLYESVLQYLLKLGPDVKACPCATMVPFYRRHVFAQLKPSTKSRLDLGLALGAATPDSFTGLIDTGGIAKKDRITHRLELTSASDFNAFAKDCIQRAYRLDSR